MAVGASYGGLLDSLELLALQDRSTSLDSFSDWGFASPNHCLLVVYQGLWYMLSCLWEKCV